jgi:hypothetical protein
MRVYNREAYEYHHYESIEEDLYHEQISHLETNVSCWTENEMEAGNIPTFEQFIESYPEWDHQTLYDTIISFIGRYQKMIEAEREANERWDCLPF